MVRFTGGLLLLTALVSAAPPELRTSGALQQVLAPGPQHQGNPRKLKGRILHITDLHPDPFYKIGTDPDGDHPCHKGSGESSAGYFGAAMTKCDSPFTLINATFRWIKENIKDEIDFVVWTGDSARHDNDEDLPRNNAQVEKLNEYIVAKFAETFGKPDNKDDPDPTNDYVVPIVPTYGNNDILPHNIFGPGPNRWTRRYIELWNSFVPAEQRHSFARGGWFFNEVIPNRLAVFSLNTLYFFDSNSAVDGCDLESEPGYEHMEWLRIQLQFLRERRMKAILIGHVPPARTDSKQAWDESCYQKYTLWQRQYRDVIVANLFGHMNIDHFMFQDVKDLTYKFRIDGIAGHDSRGQYSPHPRSNDDFHVAAKADYLNELRSGWATLPTPPKGVHYKTAQLQNVTANRNSKQRKQRDKFLKKIGGPWGERFSLSVVSPSVVPNFFPTLRIIEYNITGLKHDHPAAGAPIGTPAEVDHIVGQDFVPPTQELNKQDQVLEMGEDDFDVEKKRKKHKKKKKKKGKKKPAKPYFPVPHPPSSTSPPGPAYSPQTFTFLRWTQLYANLTKIHEDISSEFATHGIDIESESYGLESDPDWLAAARRKRQEQDSSKSVHADKHYKQFDYKVEYSTNNDKVYNMHDLTIRSWLDLAERIGRTELAPPSFEASSSNGGDYHKDVLEVQSPSHSPGSEGMRHQDQSVHLDSPSRRKGRGKLKKNHLWHAFIKRAFVHTKADSDLEGDFD